MNKANIINRAKEYFDTIMPLKDNEDIYRAELKFGKQKIAAVYYIDMNEKASLDKFEEYQETLLAKDYYNEPGDIQWNYYLLLLRDQIQNDLKQNIEKNDKYARKYVFDEKQFENFFTAEKSTIGIQLDFVGIIKQKLDEGGLQEVYGSKPYTVTVDNFVSGNIAPLSGHRKRVQETEEVIQLINSVKLNSTYRQFPKKRSFEFKKVNLIDGINGTGKTSLMEALELSVCGKTYRNPSFTEVEGCAEVIFNNGEIQEKCIPTNNSKYRSRDFTWYASSYATGNNLHESFQRYNFFNADAAQEFSNSVKDEAIKKALLNIILGTEYTYIAERIKGVYNQFVRVYNSYKKEYNIEVNKQARSEQILQTTPVSSNIESLEESIQNDYRELSFLNSDWNRDNLPEIEKLNNGLLTFLSQLKSYSKEGVFSKIDLLSHIDKIDKEDVIVKEYQNKLDDINVGISQTKTVVNNLTNRLQLLNTALKYFKTGWLSSLKGSSERLKELKDLNQKLEWALEKIKNIKISEYRSELSLTEMITQLTNNLISSTHLEKEIQLQIDEKLSGMQKKEALISEIKTLGNRFIHEHADASECPLCQSSFGTSIILQQKIETLLLGQDNVAQEQLDGLNIRLQLEKESVAKGLRRKSEFETLLQVYNNLPSTSKSVKVSELVQYLNNVNIILDRQKKEVASIQSLLDMASIEQVSESELMYVEEQLEIQFPDLLLSAENESQFLIKRSEFESREKELLLKMHQLEIEQQLETENFKKQMYHDSQSFNILNLSEQIKLRQGLFNSAMTIVRKVEELISLQPFRPFESLLAQAEILGRNMSTLRAEQQNQFIINQAKKEKKEADSYIKGQKHTKERYDKAMQTLSELNSETGNTQLVEFFEQNMTEVLDVFMTIHTPREFTSIVFKDNLFLITENGEERSVTQISTGQRSALALSIFITMNRKLKLGPNIIMFDDPVAFIDDLNALSFLDYLKYFVLKEGKQIFFATANNRLADLFEKKFSFLESDFQKHSLER